MGHTVAFMHSTPPAAGFLDREFGLPQGTPGNRQRKAVVAATELDGVAKVYEAKKYDPNQVGATRSEPPHA